VNIAAGKVEGPGNGIPDMTVRLGGIQTPERSKELPLAIDPANVHVFDRETGLRLE